MINPMTGSTLKNNSLGLLIFSFALTFAPASHSEAADLTQQCAKLIDLPLPETKITLAEVTPKNFIAPRTATSQYFPKAVRVGKPFCRVAGTIAPAINFEVWLPIDNWNGRLHGHGNGGVTGSIAYWALKNSVDNGFATVSSDMGHKGGFIDFSFAIGNHSKVIDWGYRAAHEMTIAAKSIISAYYGDKPQYSYFSGCSGGGRQGLMEAQRYPEDYDGILVGDPTSNFTRLITGGRLWAQLAMLGDGTESSYIPANKIPLIARAVNSRCDTLDGVADGVLEDPRRCQFKPESIQCDSIDKQNCLTASQVKALKKIYAGATDSKGQKIYPGYEPGGELGGWQHYISGTAAFKARQWNYARNFLRGFVFEDMEYDPLTFNYDRDVALVDNKLFMGETLASIINADNIDLRPYKQAGGKLIHYHGWSDPGVAPQSSVDYYEKVAGIIGEGLPNRFLALAKTQDFYRLFMVPGMQHCIGGPGTDNFDALSTLQDWVEKNQPPEKIIATRLNNDGSIIRSRPLCPYPRTAHYRGQGDINQANSFLCLLTAPPITHPTSVR